MKSFKEYDKSYVTFKFFFTGLAALSLLFVIGVVFSVWYILRKRREERIRHSQHIEDTFPERLASRSVAGKSSSKIDLGFTSQQTLNRDTEDGERRPTFSRFLKLWKGLRNSKRKPGACADGDEESARTVVFTIPTEDVFPKSHARQQTYHHDAVTQTNIFQTHLCEVHRKTHDVIEEYSNDDLRHLNDLAETICENETRQVDVTTEISNNKSGSTESGEMLGGGETNISDGKTGVEKYFNGKDEGKSFSKESDVDSGCGSSYHEIYATEPQITHAQLCVSSLADCPAQNTGEPDSILGKNSENLAGAKDVETKADFELCSSLEESCSSEQFTQELQTSELVTDSFEELIKLAKDGMSTLARKRVDNSGKKNKISDCFQATVPVDQRSDAQELSTHTNSELQSKNESLSSKLESQTCLDVHQVDSGVKFASCTSVCLEDNAKTDKALQSESTEKRSDSSLAVVAIDKTLHSTATANNSDTSIGKTVHRSAKGNHSDISMDEESRSTMATSVASDKPASPAKRVVEIPTITVESGLENVDNSLGTTAEIPEVPCLPNQVSISQDAQVNVKEYTEGDSNDKTNDGNAIHAIQKTVQASDERHHLTLRIQESLLNNNANVIITDKADRPRTLVLLPTNGDDITDTSMLGLKVPSLETLNLPSHGQNAEHKGRIRSFSATIRRKLSFRERISSDDLDIEKQEQLDPKSKKIKGFRSFRINKKKKTNVGQNEETSHSTGCLSDSKKYVSTIDKIFHENTGSAIFTDVPFTIPEISEQ